MARIKRVVTSNIEGRETSDKYEPNTYLVGEQGKIIWHSGEEAYSVIEPGVVHGANHDSGDGNGLNTVKLIPDSSIGTDQYLVVDPTAPNHIHIRAGGPQDGSSAELILGAEKTNVKVTDWNKNVQINTYNTNEDKYNSWNFDNLGNLTANQDAIISVSPAPGNLKISAYSGTTFTYSDNEATNGVFIKDNTIPSNRVATIGDLPSVSEIGKWQEYNPVITTTGGSTFSIGNGILYGKYTRIGDTVHFTVKISIGSSTVPGGSGHGWIISTPFDIKQTPDIYGNFDTSCVVRNINPVYRSTSATVGSNFGYANNTVLVAFGNDSVNWLSNLYPINMVQNVAITIWGTYEAVA